ncbi:MAG TPA: carbohydrate ABC transporter permease [Candidatus Limiplasma sp.]|nr:carbohydrate ABC transporter permease [Candidatus Limiplasma sp.]
MSFYGKRFSVFANIVLILLSLTCVLPLLLLLTSSLTSEDSLMHYGYSLWPREWSFESYKYLWYSRAQILNAYKMTILATTVGTLSNLTITTLMAYPLSRKGLPGRYFFSFAVFFTLLFNGGMIPSYLMWVQVFHIKDTFWALILPNLLMNGFGVIVMRTFFSTNIPDEVLEAARIDGAGETRTLITVVLPLSTPILSTIALLSGLAYWNDWINGLYYLVKRTDYYTIQNLLNRLIASADFIANNAANSALTAGVTVPSVGIRMAIAVIALVPIMMIYPFLQRGFVKGIVIGSVKG